MRFGLFRYLCPRSEAAGDPGRAQALVADHKRCRRPACSFLACVGASETSPALDISRDESLPTPCGMCSIKWRLPCSFLPWDVVDVGRTVVGRRPSCAV